MNKKTILMFFPRTLHENNYRNFHVPYSLLALITAIDLEKYDIVLIDDNALKHASYVEDIMACKDSVFCVAISSMIGAQIKHGMMFAEEVRKIRSDIPIIWGGPLVTILPELTVSNKLVDIGITGQGEQTLVEILEYLEGNGKIEDIKGAVYKDSNGKVINNGMRAWIDLNSFPAYTTVYDLLDLSCYIQNDEHIASRTISYHSSQGCPFVCGYCAEVSLWKRWWSAFEVDRMINDIKYLVNHYQVNGIKFYDSEFFIDRNRAINFAKRVIEEKIDIKWAAAAHPQSLKKLSDSDMELLKKSGLRRLLVGAETCQEDELKLINKNSSEELIIECAHKCAKYDIYVCFTFVTGYPSMPMHNIDLTFEFAKRLKATEPMHEIKLHFYGPYPGTPLYDMAVKYGFKGPDTLEGWAEHDYYNILTPWIDKSYEEKLHHLNEEFYPYIDGGVRSKH